MGLSHKELVMVREISLPVLVLVVARNELVASMEVMKILVV